MTPTVQPFTISDAAIAVLHRANVSDKIVHLPDEQLDRSLYEAVNEVLVALGGRWDRHKKGHVFDAPPADELGQVLATGQVYRHKDYQYFPTPMWLAENMAFMAFTGVDVSNIRVLEPSAGTGRLIDGAAKFGIPTEAWTCYEVNPAHVALLRSKGLYTREYDFLSDDCAPQDAIVMNPPFTKGQDIAHVTHAFKQLAPGGRLVGIVSRGARTNSTRKGVAFRELVDAHGWFEDIPAGAFEESGTGVATSMVVLDREG